VDRLPKFETEQLVERMRIEFEQLMKQVAQAVNDAPPGRVIVDSEEQVRDLLGEFRRNILIHGATFGEKIAVFSSKIGVVKVTCVASCLLKRVEPSGQTERLFL
jgi:hypothetical protein